MNKFFKVTKRGFTLVELLIVIIIIAILAGVVLVAIDPAQQRARAGATTLKTNTGAVCRAIALCLVDNNAATACDSFPELNIATPDGNPAASTYNVSTTPGTVTAAWTSGGTAFTMSCTGSGTSAGKVTCGATGTYTCAQFNL